MPRSYFEQQLSVLQAISVLLGIALLTVALFTLHQPEVPPYLPFALSAGGLLLLATSVLISLIRKCLHR